MSYPDDLTKTLRFIADEITMATPEDIKASDEEAPELDARYMTKVGDATPEIAAMFGALFRVSQRKTEEMANIAVAAVMKKKTSTSTNRFNFITFSPVKIRTPFLPASC